MTEEQPTPSQINWLGPRFLLYEAPTSYIDRLLEFTDRLGRKCGIKYQWNWRWTVRKNRSAANFL